MLTANTCTTGDCTFESVQKMIDSLAPGPPPNPMGTPVVVVQDIERFTREIGAWKHPALCPGGGIEVRASYAVPDDVICLIAWFRPGESSPNLIEKIKREVGEV